MENRDEKKAESGRDEPKQLGTEKNPKTKKTWKTTKQETNQKTQRETRAVDPKKIWTDGFLSEFTKNLRPFRPRRHIQFGRTKRLETG